jgi:hypothetical protein
MALILTEIVSMHCLIRTATEQKLLHLQWIDFWQGIWKIPPDLKKKYPRQLK